MRQTDGDSNWYDTADGLVSALRSSQTEAPFVPRIAGYEDLCELCRGGQGVVYLARQASTQRRVAIKLLPPGLDSTRRQRFAREIDLVSRLHHPRIVGIYDCGVTSEDAPYLVMEYVDGVPLGEYLAAGPLPLTDRLQLFVRICDAVSHAHLRGVLHRDLKPGNILVDRHGEPRIVDFGIARSLQRDDGAALTRADGFLGTLAYAAPEQVSEDADVDVRSDVYALGVILYELITGTPPYPTSGSLAAVVQAILNAQPVPPATVLRRQSGTGRRVPVRGGDLDAIVRKALAKNPAERYQSLDALQGDIQRYLAGDPVDARRAQPWYLFGKLLARHKLVTGLVVTLALACVGFGAAMTVLYQQAEDEARKANQIRLFLEDTLTSASAPDDGSEVTLRAVLAEAEHWIEAALGDQPEVEAAVRTTLGNSYRALGAYSDAARHASRALELRQKLCGPEHPDVAQAISLLGLVQRDQGHFAAAEQNLRDALALRRRLLGDSAPQVTYSLHNLAALLQSAGRPEEAEPVLREALALRRAALGDQHRDTAMCQFLLGELLVGLGRMDEARPLHEAALATRRATLPAGHPDVLRSEAALAE